MRTKIIRLQETDSTNRYLREYKQENGVVADMTIAIAKYQSAGKGQGTNSWESEPGKNLLFSILIHPDYVKADRQFIISMAVANAIRITIENLVLKAMVKEKVTVKWPNDIYVGDRKICGILIENRLSGDKIKDCIIGVGINVNQTVFAGDAPNPVSLKMLCREEHDHDSMLADILCELETSLDEIREMHNDMGNIRKEYKEHLFRNEGYHTFRDKDGEFKAKIHDIEDDGHLLLRDHDAHIRRYAFKEVEFCFGGFEICRNTI